MKLKFDPNQAYQLEAIEAVVNLFDGQARVAGVPDFEFGTGLGVVSNRMDLRPEELLRNTQSVQAAGRIRPDPELRTISAAIETSEGLKQATFCNFSVEMETGTGKTYVYLRTIFDLHRRYGHRKFIIVVPFVAIREGVLKTLEITREHFRELYGATPYRFTVYDSKEIAQVRQFALSDAVEIMVMTLDSFNKPSNVIHQSLDRLQGQTPLHLVQATRPVLVLDEPQNMESERAIASLATLDPLYTLRYSATHRNPYNVVHRLTPYDAYQQRLVKRVEVASVMAEGDQSRPYIRLVSMDSKKRVVSAKLAVQVLTKAGVLAEKTVKVRPQDSLVKATSRNEYTGFEIDEINPGGGFLRFANNVEIARGEEIGPNKAAIFEAQIRYTVQEHFRKQARLRSQGIKVLSLFFIDRVASYVDDDGIIKRLFVEAFDALKQSDAAWAAAGAESVQGYYFASKRKRSGEVTWEDSSSGEAEKDKAVYDLILRDKETLLSFDSPVAFIFSHSALREGWDNPNIFQICTLSQTVSEIKKRQEIGRGVRLAVNSDGERVHDDRVNVLTVVANESYQAFVGGYQREIASEYLDEIAARYGKPLEALSDEERDQIIEEYGSGILPPKPEDARMRGKARLRKEATLRPEFKELWKRISRKTQYRVEIDSEQLIADVVTALGSIDIDPPRVVVEKVTLSVSKDKVFEALSLSGAKAVLNLEGRYPLPNLVEILANLMEHTTPPVRLSRQTLWEILARAPHPNELVQNPHEFALAAVRVIKDAVARQLVAGIQYVPVNEHYEMTQFDSEVDSWMSYLEPSDKGLYDYVTYDSNVERQFVQDMERMEQVLMYVKLPGWFTVPTPIGEYNPDWAIVWEDRDEHGDPTGKPHLYLVRETKGSTDRSMLRLAESDRIYCAERHFGALGVSYQEIVVANDLPGPRL